MYSEKTANGLKETQMRMPNTWNAAIVKGNKEMPSFLLAQENNLPEDLFSLLI